MPHPHLPEHLELLEKQVRTIKAERAAFSRLTFAGKIAERG